MPERMARTPVSGVDFGTALNAILTSPAVRVSRVELTTRVPDPIASVNARANAIVVPPEDAALARARAVGGARDARLADHRMREVVSGPRGPVSAMVGEVLAPVLQALGTAGGRPEEGWPQGLDIDGPHDACLTLLYACFTPPAQAQQVEGLRRLAAN